MRLRERIQIRPTVSAATGAPASSRRDPEAVDRSPDRPLPDLAGGRVQRRQPDLGHPVALDDREAGGGRELAQQLG
jgi:hypothetical protein